MEEASHTFSMRLCVGLSIFLFAVLRVLILAVHKLYMA